MKPKYRQADSKLLMDRCRANHVALVIASSIAVWGCALREPDLALDVDAPHYAALAAATEYPDADIPAADSVAYESLPPISLDEPAPPAPWDMSLQEAVETALANSKVMRDLGGSVLRFPANAETVYAPAIRATDPRVGVEPALSAFDAQLATRLFFDKNDRAINNAFFGGGTRILRQDLANYETRLSKRTATGTEFAIRHFADYDSNNAPGNRYPSVFNTYVDAEFRQPLLQGAGLDFNRIAGPDGLPGSINGVLIARLNTDISLADFQIGLRDLLSNVENAYWDLYFAYRDLDARIAARDAALETWRVVKTWNEQGRRGGEAEKEAQAREQYFRFEEDVQNALSGLLFDRTRTYNGSNGGTFRGVAGVHVADRRLRLILGIPINDGRLIRPVDEPIMARVVFAWNEAVAEAVARRAELRRQRDQVKRRELELVANKHFLRPRLDALGRYRWRGLGQDLINATNGGKPEFDNAIGNMTGGDFQEWQLGLELSMPLGFRQGFAAVRNAQLLLARERAVLEEQQRYVLHGLSDAVAEKDRAFAVTQTAYNRLVAARQQLDASEVAFETDRAPVDLVLDAQERLADATSRFYRTHAEYSVAIKNVHYEKGSILEYNGVRLAEAPALGQNRPAARHRHHGEPDALFNYVVASGGRDRSPAGPPAGTGKSPPSPDGRALGHTDETSPPGEPTSPSASSPSTSQVVPVTYLHLAPEPSSQRSAPAAPPAVITPLPQVADKRR